MSLRTAEPLSAVHLPRQGAPGALSVLLASGCWPAFGVLGWLMHPLVGVVLFAVGVALSYSALRDRRESVIRWSPGEPDLRVTVGGGPEQVIRLDDVTRVHWCYGTLMPNWDGYRSWTNVEFHLAEGEPVGVFLTLVTPREQWTALRDLARAMEGRPIDVEWDSWIPRRTVTWDPGIRRRPPGNGPFLWGRKGITPLR